MQHEGQESLELKPNYEGLINLRDLTHPELEVAARLDNQALLKEKFLLT